VHTLADAAPSFIAHDKPRMVAVAGIPRKETGPLNERISVVVVSLLTADLHNVIQSMLSLCRMHLPCTLNKLLYVHSYSSCPQCFDAVGWVAGRASGL